MSPRNEYFKGNNIDISNKNQTLFKGGQRRGVIQEKKKPVSQKLDLETSESSKKKNVLGSLASFLLKKRKVSGFYVVILNDKNILN